MLTLNESIRIQAPLRHKSYLCVVNDIVSQWLEELVYRGNGQWSELNTKEYYGPIVEYAIYPTYKLH